MEDFMKTVEELENLMTQPSADAKDLENRIVRVRLGNFNAEGDALEATLI